MTQPPNDRRPLPWEAPDTSSGEPPTVAWTPPAADTSPPDAPVPPAGDVAPPAGEPPPAAPMPDATPAAPSPLISASPAPAVAWESPSAHRIEVAPGLVYASTLSRFVAFVLDTILIGIVTGFVAGVTGVPPLAGATVDGDFSSVFANPTFNILSAALSLAYFVFFWTGGRRATPGQRIFRIQVGNAVDGAPMTFEQAIRRWLGLGEFLAFFALAPGLAVASSTIQLLWVIALLITTATSPTKQGLHDRFANSAVVQPSDAGSGAVTACLFIVIILVGLALLSIVALIFLGGQVSSILSAVGESV